MEWEIYELTITGDGRGYWFISEGPRGRIKKIIEFQWMPGLGSSTFNLAFGDFIEGSNKLNDRSVSNNRDRVKVLHTVAAAATLFLKGHPRSIILIMPNTVARARLYQMMIAAIWKKIEQEYEVQGKHGPYWMPFVKGLNYSEFIVYKKIMGKLRMQEQKENKEREPNELERWAAKHVTVGERLPYSPDDPFLVKKLEDAYKVFEEAPLPEYLVKWQRGED